MRTTFRKIFVSVFDGEGGAAGGAGDGEGGAGGAGGAAGAGGAGAGGGNDLETVKNQAELNSVLKREKEKIRREREKFATELESHKNTAKLTAEAKEALEVQIEELRSAHMTTEERTKQQLDKLTKESGRKLEETTNLARAWESRHNDLKIGYDITSSAAAEKVLGNSVILVEALLRPKTKLVEDKDEDGEPLGTYTAMVDFPDVNKEGKAIKMTLSVRDAIKRMKELSDQYGHLFEGDQAGGAGANTGTKGKKSDLSNMDTASYMAERKKNPNLLG